MQAIAQNTTPKVLSKNIFNNHRSGGSDAGPMLHVEGANLISCPFPVVHYGFDTLEINYTVDFERTESLFENLKMAKNALQSTNDKEISFNIISNSQETEYALQRYGTKIFSYVLKKGDILFSLSNRKSGTGIPNINLKIGSISSAHYAQIKKDFEKTLLCLGCTILEEKLSRIDICKDLVCNIKDLQIQDLDFHISKARSASIFYQYKQLTGIQLGKGNVVLRIYDKIAEMEQKKDENKQEHFQKIWDNQSEITRVEFQLRREFLNDFEINSLEQFEKKLPDLWEYLTKSWFRQAEKTVDRINKNQTDTKISPFWIQVQKNTIKILNIIKKRVKKNICNMKSLLNQATGCLVSICGALGMYPDDKNQILETMKELINQGLEENFKNFENFQKKITTRRASLINY